MILTQELVNAAFAACGHRQHDLNIIIEAVQEGLGIKLSPAEACTMWEHYSSSMDAGWLSFDSRRDARRAEICGVLEDFVRSKLGEALA